jgi:hypothetical protein
MVAGSSISSAREQQRHHRDIDVVKVRAAFVRDVLAHQVQISFVLRHEDLRHIERHLLRLRRRLSGFVRGHAGDVLHEVRHRGVFLLRRLYAHARLVEAFYPRFLFLHQLLQRNGPIATCGRGSGRCRCVGHGCRRRWRGRRGVVAVAWKVFDLGQARRLECVDLILAFDFEIAEQEGVIQPAVELDVQADTQLVHADHLAFALKAAHAASFSTSTRCTAVHGDVHKIVSVIANVGAPRCRIRQATLFNIVDSRPSRHISIFDGLLVKEHGKAFDERATRILLQSPRP